jgi:hypothetical protein
MHFVSLIIRSILLRCIAISCPNTRTLYSREFLLLQDQNGVGWGVVVWGVSRRNAVNLYSQPGFSSGSPAFPSPVLFLLKRCGRVEMLFLLFTFEILLGFICTKHITIFITPPPP